MKDIHESIGKYYTGKVSQFGTTPQGVDWKDEASQLIRLEQLMHIVREREQFTINDLGCGYGRLLFYLVDMGCRNFAYRGYDVSGEMIRMARDLASQRTLPTLSEPSFNAVKTSADMTPAEYTVASGIFNVKMHHDNDEWSEYILQTLDQMNRFSTKGFSFNVLTKYSDRERMRSDLFYADPCHLFDHCKRRYSRNVALLHDYDLYEFTVLVRKG